MNVYKLYNESEDVELRDSVINDVSIISDTTSIDIDRVTIAPSDSLSQQYAEADWLID